MRNVPSLEAIKRDYAPKGVRFFFIYKSLAHPETNGYVQPLSLKERLQHIQEARKKLGATIDWLCDGMDNAAKHALGDAPNSEFVVGPDGRIVVRRLWSRPEQLRKDLAKLVGPVAHPTTAADTGLRPYLKPLERPNGKVAQAKRSAGMVPLVVRSAASETPYYVKLRAEADRSLLRSGKGKLYLGFRLDPLYGVHFNNLSGPFTYEINVPEGWSVEPSNGEGPKVDADTDEQPRSFLVEVRRGQAPAKTVTFRVTARYIGCHDGEGWCRPLAHAFEVELRQDPDGGRVRRGGRPGDRFAGGPPGGRNREGMPFRRGGPMPGGPRGRFGRRLPPIAGAERAMGRVESYDRQRRRLTVRTPDGKTLQLQITDRTFIVRRGQGRVEPSAIRPRDRVRMLIGPAVEERKGKDSDSERGAVRPVLRMMLMSP